MRRPRRALVLLALASCSASPEQRGRTEAQSADSLAAAIDRAVLQLRTDTATVYDMSAEGGTLAASYDGASLRRLRGEYFGETGKYEERFYFDSAVFLVVTREVKYDAPLSGKIVDSTVRRIDLTLPNTPATLRDSVAAEARGLLQRLAKRDEVEKSAAAVPAPFTVPWHTVFTDTELAVGLDTSRVQRMNDSSYRVWMQTRWATPRYGSKKRTPSPFNREMIRTYLRCDPVAYKVVSTVVSLDDGPPVDSVVVGDDAARAGKWKVAEASSADAGAGQGACAIIRARAKAR